MVGGADFIFEHRHLKVYGSKVREALGVGLVPAKAQTELSLGEVVRILRDKHGLTQSELAERAGLSQATISSIENERVSLGVERAKSLARALRVHPSALLFPSWDVEDAA